MSEQNMFLIEIKPEEKNFVLDLEKGPLVLNLSGTNLSIDINNVTNFKRAHPKMWKLIVNFIKDNFKKGIKNES